MYELEIKILKIASKAVKDAQKIALKEVLQMFIVKIKVIFSTSRWNNNTRKT